MSKQAITVKVEIVWMDLLPSISTELVELNAKFQI